MCTLFFPVIEDILGGGLGVMCLEEGRPGTSHTSNEINLPRQMTSVLLIYVYMKHSGCFCFILYILYYFYIDSMQVSVNALHFYNPFS